MKKWITFILFLLLCRGAYAACSGSSPNWTAADTSLAEVTACFNAASNGDTINIPEGESTWASALQVGSKSVTFQGAGAGKTILSLSSGLHLFIMGNGTTRILDMTLKSCGIRIDGKDFEIGRILFDNSSLNNQIRLVQVQGMYGYHPYGVIHSSYFDNASLNVDAVYDTNTVMGETWALPYGFGDPRAMIYIEGNTFVKTAGITMNVIDGRMGARTVMRFNSILANATGNNNAFHIEAHSVQDTNSLRGYMRWEYYNNIQDNQGDWHWHAFRIRAGTGVVFNNAITGKWEQFGIAIDNVRSYSGVGMSAGPCDGNSGWDGNEGVGSEAGYPCRDQIGRGYDAVPWVDNPPGAYTQVLMPAYAWNNKNQNNIECPFMVVNSTEHHIKANRDYYNYTPSYDGSSGMGMGLYANRPATCTVNTAYFATDVGNGGILYQCKAGNTWEKIFEPYTCPHQLADPEGDYHCDFSVAGVAGYGMEGAPDEPEEPEEPEPEPTGVILPWIITGG
jgi:hypothetical protein